MKTIKFLSAILFSIAVAACGGGGGAGGTTADTAAPTIISTSPASGATGVAINTTAIVVTFSEAMDPATVTTSTFSIAGVSGNVTYSGTTATFTPSSALAYSITYTATVTTGVKDAAGNALASNHTWTFTVGANPDTTAPTVSPTSPADNATGVAVNSAITATFNEPVLASTVNTSTFTLSGGVTGTVSNSGNIATFTPAASLAYSTVYTATITAGVTDLAGNARTSDYTWTFTTTAPPTISSTTPASGALNVASNTNAIVATFSEEMDPSTVTASTFTLSDGTSAVTGTVDYSGTTATFTPTSALSSSTTYTATLTTGIKDMAGNALASDYTWTFTVGAVSDAIAPTVSSTSPANNATGVGVNAAITATFSEPMLASAINSGTFTLSNGVTGTVTYSGTTATFTPSSTLAYSTSYTATINADSTRKDLADNALAISYTWSFTTGAATDTTAPTVPSTSPANAAPGVAPNTAITATFSEPVSASTVNLGTFTLINSTTSAPVAGAVTYSGTTATFTPASALANLTNYTATITTGVKDLAGNALASTPWSFTTGSIVDSAAPTVLSTSPVNGATNATAQNPITATFSEALDASTVSTATFTLAQGATPITGAVTYSGTTATFTPSVKLVYSTGYTATISSQVKDLAGNALAPTSWSFTTRLTPVVNAVAAGVAHTVALKDDGTLWSWGYNLSGQLGVGDLIDRYAPTQIGTATNWAVMAAGDYHTLALKSDGTLWAWGDNASGQLGDGSMTNRKAPVLITNTTPSTTWTAIAGGANHSLAIKSDGTLWAWGDNTFGQLGDGTTTPQLAPKQIGALTTWSVVGTGNTHSLAIKTTDGTLWAWGENSFGQLGDGTQVHRNVPTQIGSATNWQRIDGGYAHTVAIQADKTLWGWGWNLDGGGNVWSGTYQLTPLKLGLDTDWSAISAGDAHSVAFKTNWVLYAWGLNDKGQLGDGTVVDKFAPVPISY